MENVSPKSSGYRISLRQKGATLMSTLHENVCSIRTCHGPLQSRGFTSKRIRIRVWPSFERRKMVINGGCSEFSGMGWARCLPDVSVHPC